MFKTNKMSLDYVYAFKYYEVFISRVLFKFKYTTIKIISRPPSWL